MMGTSWPSIIRRRTTRNWMEKLWSRGIRREGCVCPGSGAIGVWKSSKLKIGSMQASRSIPIGIGASLGRYYGGQDWPLEFRAATTQKEKKDMDCARILRERYTSPLFNRPPRPLSVQFA